MFIYVFKMGLSKGGMEGPAGGYGGRKRWTAQWLMGGWTEVGMAEGWIADTVALQSRTVKHSESMEMTTRMGTWDLTTRSTQASQ